MPSTTQTILCVLGSGTLKVKRQQGLTLVPMLSHIYPVYVILSSFFRKILISTSRPGQDNTKITQTHVTVWKGNTPPVQRK